MQASPRLGALPSAINDQSINQNTDPQAAVTMKAEGTQIDQRMIQEVKAETTASAERGTLFNEVGI
jgi:hypothetical protein